MKRGIIGKFLPVLILGILIVGGALFLKNSVSNHKIADNLDNETQVSTTKTTTGDNAKTQTSDESQTTTTTTAANNTESTTVVDNSAEVNTPTPAAITATGPTNGVSSVVAIVAVAIAAYLYIDSRKLMRTR